MASSSPPFPAAIWSAGLLAVDSVAAGFAGAAVARTFGGCGTLLSAAFAGEVSAAFGGGGGCSSTFAGFDAAGFDGAALGGLTDAVGSSAAIGGGGDT